MQKQLYLVLGYQGTRSKFIHARSNDVALQEARVFVRREAERQQKRARASLYIIIEPEGVDYAEKQLIAHLHEAYEGGAR